MADDPKRYTKLVRQVFDSREGRALLNEWEQMYCGRMFHADPLKMAEACARRDLIWEVTQELKND